MPMKTLDEIAIACGTDKATLKADFPDGLGHGYAPIYDRLFTPLRDRTVQLLEIGVGGGESIRAWLEYFPNASVFGVDKVRDTNLWNVPGAGERYTFANGDQSCATFWACFISDYGRPWDIIIDDGSHISEDIIKSFECLWPHVASGGLYCIEDLKVAPDALAYLKGIVGDIQAATGGAESIQFSRELCILRKA
jgi:demethylmacrocin O-methyltransferase